MVMLVGASAPSQLVTMLTVDFVLLRLPKMIVTIGNAFEDEKSENIMRIRCNHEYVGRCDETEVSFLFPF